MPNFSNVSLTYKCYATPYENNSFSCYSSLDNIGAPKKSMCDKFDHDQFNRLSKVPHFAISNPPKLMPVFNESMIRGDHLNSILQTPPATSSSSSSSSSSSASPSSSLASPPLFYTKCNESKDYNYTVDEGYMYFTYR